MSDSFAGKLLVAGPELTEATFARTVVLVCLHDAEGAFGLILNRPYPAPVVDHLPAWGEWASRPAVLFEGGPVDPTAVVGLGRTRDAEALAIPVSQGVGLLNLGRAPGDWTGALDAVRVFAGYSGWAAGQLEAEVLQQAWFVLDAEPGDPFSESPEDLWRRVLRRQRGEPALYAHLPRDPSMN
jgi:putative transcriptional regulator